MVYYFIEGARVEDDEEYHFSVQEPMVARYESMRNSTLVFK
jgi:hypothetical protein